MTVLAGYREMVSREATASAGAAVIAVSPTRSARAGMMRPVLGFSF